MPCKLAIFRLSDPEERGEGEALIRDISEGGAYLSDIRVQDRTIPAEPFRVIVAADTPPLAPFEEQCRVVRLLSTGGIHAGVAFDHLSESSRERILALA